MTWSPASSVRAGAREHRCQHLRCVLFDGAMCEGGSVDSSLADRLYPSPACARAPLSTMSSRLFVERIHRYSSHPANGGLCSNYCTCPAVVPACMRRLKPEADRLIHDLQNPATLAEPFRHRSPAQHKARQCQDSPQTTTQPSNMGERNGIVKSVDLPSSEISKILFPSDFIGVPSLVSRHCHSWSALRASARFTHLATVDVQKRRHPTHEPG